MDCIRRSPLFHLLPFLWRTIKSICPRTPACRPDIPDRNSRAAAIPHCPSPDSLLSSPRCYHYRVVPSTSSIPAKAASARCIPRGRRVCTLDWRSGILFRTVRISLGRWRSRRRCLNCYLSWEHFRHCRRVPAFFCLFRLPLNFQALLMEYPPPHPLRVYSKSGKDAIFQ